MSQDVDFSVHVSPDQNFSCHSHGNCCTSGWRVRVAEDEVQKVESTEAFKSSKREGYQPIAVIDDIRQLGRREDNSCVFHSEGGCDIHREKGAEMKPSVCQNFPYNMVNTPDGFFVSLSFSCPSVLKDLGESLSNQVGELKNIISESPYIDSSKDLSEQKVTITHDCQVSWKEYLKHETVLSESIKGEDFIYELLAASVYFASLAHQAESDNSSLSGNADLAETLGSAVELLPLFVLNSISVLEEPKNADSRAELVERLLQGEALSSTLLSKQLPPFRFCSPRNDIIKNTFKRYIQNLIWGKRLITGPSVVTLLLLLATALSTALYYLEAGLGEHKTPDDKDLEWAFTFIEKEFMTHNTELIPMFSEYEKAILAYLDIS